MAEPDKTDASPAPTASEGRAAPDPRVSFAAERTLLAWIRTGLALMGFGFVVARFGLFVMELAAVSSARPMGPQLNASLVGVALVAAGVVVNVWAVARHVRFTDRLARGQELSPSPLGPSVLGLGAAAGGILLATLLARALLE